MNLYDEYIKITKLMLSALKARKLDIFENLLSDRKEVLNKMYKNADNNTINEGTTKKELKELVVDLENKIRLEMDKFKLDVEEKQAKNKLKLFELNKSKKIHDKYKNSGKLNVSRFNKLK